MPPSSDPLEVFAVLVRILIVCDFLFKYGSQQGRSLVAMGHDVAILCRSHSLEFGGSTAEREEWLSGLTGDGVSLFVVPGRVRSASAAPVMWRLRRDIGAWSPQIVHVHENHDPRLLALTSGYLTVLTVHDPLGHPGAPELTRAENWVFRRWFRRARRFVVHGRALVEELAPIVGGEERIVVIPHGTTPRARPLPAPNRPIVLLFGRLEEYKGVEVLAAAMHRVWERRQDVRLIVAGDGPAARLVPADRRVTLMARYIPESEVEPLLAEASLVALPYTQASQSGVGLLAIAAGVPVVVSDLGSLPELACDPSYIAAAGRPDVLAEVILRHLDDGEQERAAVLRHARCRFSWELAAERTTALYRELVGEVRPSGAPHRSSSST
jgi:glycosyltransferase involved in cell wall biosynthesis